MKTIFMTMAAVSAMAVAAPATARSWTGHANSAQLQIRIDAGVGNGAISPREAVQLRDGLRRMARQERQYSRNGFTPRERNTLQRRGAVLDRQIVRAERSGATRVSMDSRFDHANRGDRFAGDIRVGQYPSARMIALPERYRADYRDSDAVYYRYDQNRIYRVNRLSNLVSGMIDLPN